MPTRLQYGSHAASNLISSMFQVQVHCFSFPFPDKIPKIILAWCSMAMLLHSATHWERSNHLTGWDEKDLLWHKRVGWREHFQSYWYVCSCLRPEEAVRSPGSGVSFSLMDVSNWLYIHEFNQPNEGCIPYSQYPEAEASQGYITCLLKKMYICTQPTRRANRLWT